MSKLSSALDYIEQWLKDAPTHPSVQYGESSDADGRLVGITPLVVDTWDTQAMLAEWRMIRRRCERK